MIFPAVPDARPPYRAHRITPAAASGRSDLESGDFGNLPDTQDQPRLAIIEWRTQLQLAATKAGFPLPADIEQAGRGEIAPGVTGS